MPTNTTSPRLGSCTVRRFVRILMFHICALIALIILCPFRYAFEMVAPWFRWGIRNWVAFNLPSIGDYWTSAISPSALRMQRDFIFANNSLNPHKVKGQAPSRNPQGTKLQEQDTGRGQPYF